MANTPRLSMPYLVAGQAQKEISHNDALNDMDSLAQMSVINKTTATPPATPAEGDSYIIASSPTGAWAGNANAVVSYYSGWRIKTPKAGWLAYVQAEGVFYLYDGSAWNMYKGVVPLGSASAPSYSFVGDSDTGVYSPGANQWAVATSGTLRFSVDASGNASFTGTIASAAHYITSNSSSAFVVGANGATNPAFQVDDSMSSQNAGLKLVAGASGTAPQLQVTSPDANQALVFITKGNSPFRFSNSSTVVATPNTDPTIKIRNTSSTTNNASVLQFENTAGVAVAQIDGVNESHSVKTGSMVFYTGVSGTLTQAMKIDSASNVIINTAALATNATSGFLYIPTCAGAPTGTPTSYVGRVPIVFDATNNKLCIYNGAWKTVTLI